MIQGTITKFVLITTMTLLLTSVGDVFGQSAPMAPLPDVAPAAPNDSTNGLNLDMKLDDLAKQSVVVPGLSTEVSTVDRQKSTIGRSPAAVFVITQEMIKRSGARSIPDALRMAPGVNVARINTHMHAITIRGYNDRYSNFLLVQIDGRVIYQGTFGGVYWNQQDVVLADVERIEVIRSPGTIMYGSNAMNGVINIITKKTTDTQGELVQAGGGVDQERGFVTGRHGGKINEHTSYRVYAQQFDISPGFSESNVPDAYHGKSGGFRIDNDLSKDDLLTIQGNIFEGKLGQQFENIAFPTPPYSRTVDNTNSIPASHLLMRYGHTIDADTSWQFQSYYDHYEQNFSLLNETRNTYDLDLQYRSSPREGHHFVSGVNYRNSQDKIEGSFAVSYDPPQFITEWVGIYSQDTMTLEEDRWYFTLGCRLEEHTFGGFQAEPGAKLLFLPSDRKSVWASVTRAARNPTRLDRHYVGRDGLDPSSPDYILYLGNSGRVAESVLAYELGYRSAPTDTFSWDIAGYINDYNNLFDFEEGTPFTNPQGTFYPVIFNNNARSTSAGFEISATRKLSNSWQTTIGYSVFEMLRVNTQISYFYSTPNNQLYLQSSWDFDDNKTFDLIGRYTDSLELGVPSYFEADARLGWQMTKTLELSFVGRNLLDSHHLEFISYSNVPTEVRRSWYAMLTWVY